jgi:hypothetical protein
MTYVLCIALKINSRKLKQPIVAGYNLFSLVIAAVFYRITRRTNLHAQARPCIDAWGIELSWTTLDRSDRNLMVLWSYYISPEHPWVQ